MMATTAPRLLLGQAACLAVAMMVTMATGDICTKKTCEYEFELSWARTMTHYREGAAYRVALNGSELTLTESMYRTTGDDPDMVGRTVQQRDVITADGVERDVIVINGQFPGPTIEVMEGAEVVVRVTNRLLMHGATIHWHGLFQRGTPFMDGAAHVSQCAIMPGQAFTYRFAAEPPGTHWYHSHILNQKSDGLFGIFIIHQTIPKIPQFPMSLTDWFHVPGTTLAGMNPVGLVGNPRVGAGDIFMRNPSEDVVAGVPIEIATMKIQSSLINGRGRFSNDSKLPLTTFQVDAGERYRFRVVCAAQEVGFTVSIDGHQLDIVALDGEEIMTVRADAFMIHPGESLDFVVLADSAPGQYWIRTEAMQHGDMDHSSMGHSSMNHEDMDHGDMDHGDMDHGDMDHGDMDHGDMDHGDMDHADMGHRRRKRHGDEEHEAHEAHNVRMDDEHHASGHAHHHIMVDAVRAIFSYTGGGHAGHDPSSAPRTCTSDTPCLTFGCAYQEVSATKRCIGVEEARSVRTITAEFGLDVPDDDVIETFVNVGFAYRSSINARRFVHPSHPPYSHLGNVDEVMTSCDEEDCRDGCECTHKVQYPLNRSVQMVISNVRPCALSVVHHAIHLHGHNFAVLAVGYENATAGSSEGPASDHAHHKGMEGDSMCDTGNDDIKCDTPLCAHASWKGKKPHLNLKNPPVRDTISIPAKGYAVIRFVTNNPGFWLLHCHNSMHFMEGMAMLIQEGSPENIPAFPKNFPQCKNFDFTKQNLADYKADKYNYGSCDMGGAPYVNVDFLQGKDSTKLVIPVATVVICCLAIFTIGIITATIPMVCIMHLRRRKPKGGGAELINGNRRGSL